MSEENVPDIAKNVVSAFNVCLNQDLITPNSALDLATLMLELASLHQLVALQEKQGVTPENTAFIEECREKINLISKNLNLNVQTKTSNQK